MFKQTDKQMNPVGEWGCFLISILKIDEDVSQTYYTPRAIHDKIAENLLLRNIDHECTILRHQALLDTLRAGLEYLGEKPHDYKVLPGERAIREMFNDRTRYTHFVVEEEGDAGIWDPIPNSVTAREGRVVGKRVFRKKETGDGQS